ncbi:gastrula zinc finger protein XlCGF57.1-like isoform X2 [Hetaerina americana]
MEEYEEDSDTPVVHSDSHEDEIDVKALCECELKTENENVTNDDQSDNTTHHNGSIDEDAEDLQSMPMLLQYKCEMDESPYADQSKDSMDSLTNKRHASPNKAAGIMSLKSRGENDIVHKRKGGTCKGPPYACDQCWLVFSSSEYLFKHKKFIHKGQLLKVSTTSSDLRHMVDKTSGPESCQGPSARKEPIMESDEVVINPRGQTKNGTLDGIMEDGMANMVGAGFLGGGLKEEGRDSGSGVSLSELGCRKEDGEDSVDFQCTICGDLLSSAEMLQAHLLQHTLDKPLVCKVCGIRFKWKSCLSRHVRTHTQHRPYQCDECGKGFITKSDLRKHTRWHTSERPYPCSTCGKRFVHSGDLGKHKRTHTKETPYECSVCGRRFSLTGSLQSHLRTHTKEKPHECPDCGKCFAERSNLKGHMRTHTGELPHACTMCGKRFPVRRGLEQHVRTHTKEKPYACTLCPKKFAVKGDLSRHTRVHTKEKPYACHLCEKRFIDSSNLKSHVRSHSGERPFECSVCQKRFSRGGNLKAHMKTHDKPQKAKGLVKGNVIS